MLRHGLAAGCCHGCTSADHCLDGCEESMSRRSLIRHTPGGATDGAAGCMVVWLVILECTGQSAIGVVASRIRRPMASIMARLTHIVDRARRRAELLQAHGTSSTRTPNRRRSSNWSRCYGLIRDLYWKKT